MINESTMNIPNWFRPRHVHEAFRLTVPEQSATECVWSQPMVPVVYRALLSRPEWMRLKLILPFL